MEREQNEEHTKEESRTWSSEYQVNENIESLNISNSAAIVFHHLSYIKKMLIS